MRRDFFSVGSMVVGLWSLLTPAQAEQTASFVLPSGVAVEIVEDVFDRSLFEVEVSGSDAGYVLLINGQMPFGSDLSLPFSYVKHIRVTHRGKTYELDVSNMYNAWGNRHQSTEKYGVRYFGGKCVEDGDGRKYCRFRGLFSDAAGAYVAEWRIYNGVSQRTILSDNCDVMYFVSEHIDPEEISN
ncbi:MAG: hypothetical protein LBS49_03625 [Candidatus Accumulibacter sp.]|jgi:hypothetical protein|nr:hypothetical protein [Accumulibacter sp.]